MGRFSKACYNGAFLCFRLSERKLKVAKLLPAISELSIDEIFVRSGFENAVTLRLTSEIPGDIANAVQTDISWQFNGRSIIKGSISVLQQPPNRKLPLSHCAQAIKQSG